MSFNTFGHMFRVTTFGESHGIAIGCVLDGCPPLIPLTNEDIQQDLDRRRPGQSRFTTQRQEPDAVKILSGVMAHPETGVQVTTGTPIALLIENTDQRSKDYSDIKDKFRPGHADFTYEAKYGLRDYRGGGRSSARETAMRVAAGAIARKIVPGMNVRGALVQMGPHKIDRDKWDWDEIGRNPFFCPDRDKAAFFEEYLDGVRKNGSSIGAVIEVIAEGVPAGLGAPIYAKLDADLAAALMSINAVKGVEIGAGFDAAELSGEENADEMRMTNHGASFLSNHAGGILVRTRHPEIFGRRFIWKAGAEVEIGSVDFSFQDSAEFSNSPLSIVFKEGVEVRVRADDPASKSFPILDDLRAEGVTDYVALPLLFISGQAHASSWT